MRWPSAGLLAVAVAAGSAAAAPLDALRWQKRVLLVFAQGDSEAAHRQVATLDPAGRAERDLVVVAVPEAGRVEVPRAGATEAAALRRAFGVAADAPFTVLLVGKDGGVKRRANAPIGEAELFDTIDAMPMRRNEMRRD